MRKGQDIVVLDNAWFLTWEGTRGPARGNRDKVIAVLSGRRSSSAIEAIVDVIYTRCCWTAFDQSIYANKRKERVAQFSNLRAYPDQILYGRDPCIFARRVQGLTIERDDENQLEHIRWTEPPVFGNAEIGSGVEEMVAEEHKSLTRELIPLSAELYRRPT